MVIAAKQRANAPPGRSVQKRFFFVKAACYLFICLSALLALSNLVFSGSWFSSHEDWRYFVLLDQVRKSFLSGNLYPRWMPDLFGGYGYPTFVFYQPGFFFAGLLFSILPGYPLYVFYVLLLFLFILGSIAVFEIALLLVKEYSAALFVAIMFLLTPYLYVNLFVRGALSELMAMLLTPLPLLFLFRFAKTMEINGRVSILNLAFLVFFFGLVILSHPATALFYVPAFALLAILQAKELAYRHQYLVHISVAALLAFLWTSSYWFPLIQMRPYVQMNRLIEGPYRASAHVVHWPQFFSRFWGFGNSGPSPDDSLPLPLGTIHFTVACLGFCLSYRTRLIRHSFLIYLVLILMMSPLSTLLWDKFLPLRFVQFPWRLLSVTAIFQALAISGLALFLRGRIPVLKKMLYGALIGITVLWQLPAFKPQSRVDFKRGYYLFLRNLRTGFHTFAVTWEYTPKNGAEKVIGLGPRGNGRPLVETESRSKIFYQKGHSPFRIRFKTTLHKKDTITINQIYFPDWKIMVNQRELSQPSIRKSLGPDARIRIGPLPPGTYEVVAFYKGPPHSRARQILATILASILVTILVVYNKRENRSSRREKPG